MPRLHLRLLSDLLFFHKTKETNAEREKKKSERTAKKKEREQVKTHRLKRTSSSSRIGFNYEVKAMQNLLFFFFLSAFSSTW